MTIEKQKTLPDLLLDDETFELLMDCIHCGFCLPTCPTFALTGDETDSPRGRLYYMRLMAEGRVAASPSVLTHLDRCLDCRACETACPSGVQYGFLIERVRSLLAQKGKGPVRHSFFYQFLIRYIFPFANRTEVLFSPVRISQKLGISKILCRLPFLGRLMSMVPPLPPLKLRHLPERRAPAGAKKGRVGLFKGGGGRVF
ncbi:MAG: 4Fe-4S dicluster domain-containing protein [Armatimonadota bacterium]|nr:4Fe-4S dicluster domain-containing protein [Armatimonadota bacterium]